MNYDLITHQVNQFAGVMPISIFDKKSLNKRKGITEIRDLTVGAIGGLLGLLLLLLLCLLVFLCAFVM